MQGYTDHNVLYLEEMKDYIDLYKTVMRPNTIVDDTIQTRSVFLCLRQAA